MVNRFEKYVLVAMSIALLVVASANAFINYRQNEMVNDLYDRFYLLDAQVSTNEGRCISNFNALVKTQLETLDALKSLVEEDRNG